MKVGSVLAMRYDASWVLSLLFSGCIGVVNDALCVSSEGRRKRLPTSIPVINTFAWILFTMSAILSKVRRPGIEQ